MQLFGNELEYCNVDRRIKSGIDAARPVINLVGFRQVKNLEVDDVQASTAGVNQHSG